MENMFKVRNNTNSQKLALAIMKAIQNGERVVLRCLGASSINQAVKSLCILRGMGATIGLDITYFSTFDMEYKDEDNFTFIKFYIQTKSIY